MWVFCQIKFSRVSLHFSLPGTKGFFFFSPHVEMNREYPLSHLEDSAKKGLLDEAEGGDVLTDSGLRKRKQKNDPDPKKDEGTGAASKFLVLARIGKFTGGRGTPNSTAEGVDLTEINQEIIWQTRERYLPGSAPV